MADQHDKARDGAPLVVGVGASAGGIKALQEFFSHAPARAGIAYGVILHLSPDHDSRLAEVLQATTGMRVRRITESVRIEPDHVYVMPPNKSLEARDHHLIVSDVTRLEQRRAPVDIFFRALADAHGMRAAAVVLSGTGPNGSSGLKRIKEYGGLTIAQDPNEAEYGDMPRNAIATGLVDYVLPVAEIGARIAGYYERLRREGPDEDGAFAAAADPEAMDDVLRLVRVRTGHDFSSYKPATLRRRVHRRVYLRGLASVASYARAMREQPDEAVALMKELLISVTNFFRDPAAFDTFAKKALPRIFNGKHAQEQVRVWVPGCATGEEAYSIAMLLAEYAAASLDPPAIQIFGTDLDEKAIATAREGFYTDAEVADLSEARLNRFFQREAGGYRVRRELRETVLFASHNVIKDPPFSHLDLISCRNLLIYLNRPAQDRIIATFHFALRPGGYLLLGTSESSDSAHELFHVVDKNAHLYESRTVTARPAVPTEERPAVPQAAAPRRERAAERISPAELHQRLLEQYAPPSLVLTEEHNIVHMSDRVGRFLTVTGGEPTRDVMRQIRPELRADLRMALHEAARKHEAVQTVVRGVPLADGRRDVCLVVRPVLREADPLRGYFVVLFDAADKSAAPEPTVQPSASSDPAVFQVNDELSRLKAQLRVTIEQYDTQAEEAKAANEELQAMNEELRSSAEELETSKEELQSLNEELTTVNQELKIKIEELGVTNNDFQNLMNTSHVGTIFLDRNLRVKLSTPAARAIFNLLQTDVGRRLSDITSQILYANLHADVRQVLDQLEPIDREVETRDGHWHMMRLRPYRTTDNRIDGVVITFQDISEQRRAEQQLRLGDERMRLLLDSAIDYAIFTINVDGTIDTWNVGAQRMFGYAAEEIVGQPLELLFTPEDRAAGVPADEIARAARDGRASDERFHVRKNGERFYCSGVTTRLNPPGLGFVKIARDLTDQRQAADALRDVQANLERRVAERTRALQAEILERKMAQDEASALVRKVVTSQEEERARVARDLHDQLGQRLTALRLLLERVVESGGDEQLKRAVDLATRIDNELGFLAWELRPAALDDLGLEAALPRYVSEWAEHYGIAAEFRSSGLAAGRLSSEAEVAFYRVAQEALTNVAKHAHASRVDVMLESRDGSVVLVVEDNGAGFDPADPQVKQRGIGLAGLNERAALIGATLQIETGPGNGTSVFLRCPSR